MANETPLIRKKPLRLVRLPEVKDRTGLSKTVIYRRMASGTFPTPRDIGGRAVAWLESDLEAWIQARPDAQVASPK